MHIYKLEGDWAGLRGMKARGFLQGAEVMGKIGSMNSKLCTLDTSEHYIVIKTNRPRLVGEFKRLFECDVTTLEAY